MRAPFQILVIPYKIIAGAPVFCLFRRTDSDYWQFIAGGGEDNETPLEAAKRETHEEVGVEAGKIQQLVSTAYVPAEVVAACHRQHWDNKTYVIPEYAFAFACNTEPVLSHEHKAYTWLPYEAARKLLKWDSNKVAMYELNKRLTK